MRVTVTGASGIIGSFISNSFLAAGEEVLGIYRETVPNIKAARFRSVKADLSRAVFSSERCDLLIHCAAVHPTGKLPCSPDNLVQGNINSALNLCRFVEEHGVQKVIFLSSLSVYGSPKTGLLTEDTLPDNPDLYGLSKLFAESIFKKLAVNTPVLVIRLPGVLSRGNFGPWIGRTLANAKEGRPIKLYNSSAVFNHATDLHDISRLILLLAKKSWSGFDVVNLGAEPGLPVFKIAKRLIEATHSRSQIIEENAAQQAQTQICLKRVIESYGFRPSSLSEMLERYLGGTLEKGAE